jgi:hypothetical protein
MLPSSGIQDVKSYVNQSFGGKAISIIKVKNQLSKGVGGGGTLCRLGSQTVVILEGSLLCVAMDNCY